MVKVHNEIFKNKKTSIIEFGVDRGGTLTTICKFVKKETEIFALDSFGFYADDIKTNVTNYDEHYLGKYKPFTKKTRFKEFEYLSLEKQKLSVFGSFFPFFLFVLLLLHVFIFSPPFFSFCFPVAVIYWALSSPKA